MEIAVIPSDWARFSGSKTLLALTTGKLYPSVEELPQWIQERYAVLRLLEEGEASPLGKWRIDRIGPPTFVLYIIRQPGDPKWEK